MFQSSMKQSWKCFICALPLRNELSKEKIRGYFLPTEIKSFKKLVLIFPQDLEDGCNKLILIKTKLIKTVNFLTFKRDETLMPLKEM